MSATQPITADNRMDHKDEYKNLKDDIRTLKDDISKVSAAMLEQGRDVAATIKDQATDQFDRSVNSARDYVKHRPLTSALVAAGIGLVAGLVLFRR